MSAYIYLSPYIFLALYTSLSLYSLYHWIFTLSVLSHPDILLYILISLFIYTYLFIYIYIFIYTHLPIHTSLYPYLFISHILIPSSFHQLSPVLGGRTAPRFPPSPSSITMTWFRAWIVPFSLSFTGHHGNTNLWCAQKCPPIVTVVVVLPRDL